MDPKKGILDGLLGPLGQQLVDPNGQVSGMMDPVEAEKKRLQMIEMQKQKSIMEQAAPEAPAPRKEAMSSWNPFVWLFGQPGESGGGVIGK